MADLRSSLLLCFDGSGTPALRRQQLKVHPGFPFPAFRQTDTVYLASGFPSLHPDSNISLSPTLQLNADLTACSQQMLAAIGLAELNKVNSTRFPSFTRHADPAVIVLGTSEQQLRTFLDTYGGVLEITPLLTTGSSPDFDTLIDPAATSGNRSLILHYLVSQPIDRTQCTLCGSCGPVCPEQCISSTLTLDLDRCTHCNRCLDICPANAIDLHAVVSKAAEAPALLLLDGADIDLPQANGLLYREDHLNELFSTIFDTVIDEVISCEHELCQYCGRLDIGCRKCVVACRFGALRTTADGIVIDQEKCTECGMCAATCPTGAMQYLRFQDRLFVEYFSALDLHPEKIVIGDEEHFRDFWWANTSQFPQTLFLEYPQPHALTAMHFLFLLARGASQVILLDEDTLNEELQSQVSLAMQVCNKLFARTDTVIVAQSSTLQQHLEQEKTSLVSKPLSGHGFIHRRDQLAACLDHLQQAAKRSVRLEGKVFDDFGSLECDTARCTLCLACLNECSTGALASDPATLALTLDVMACVQCGTCVAICPENALKQLPGLTLDETSFTPLQLAKADPMQCRECGKFFGTRQSFERVMHIMRQRETEENLELYQYCDTCRVRKIYEAGQ